MAVSSQGEAALASRGLPQRWAGIARPRARSADEALLEALLDNPIVNVEVAQTLTGTTEASTCRALDRLTAVGILEVLSESRRSRVWAAVDVIAELDALSAAIGKRTLHGG